eukprot:scpid44116/ scgid21021/ 
MFAIHFSTRIRYETAKPLQLEDIYWYKQILGMLTVNFDSELCQHLNSTFICLSSNQAHACFNDDITMFSHFTLLSFGASRLAVEIIPYMLSSHSDTDTRTTSNCVFDSVLHVCSAYLCAPLNVRLVSVYEQLNKLQ